MSLDPLTPLAHWGWDPPYRTKRPRFDRNSVIEPVHTASGLVTSSRGGIVHIATVIGAEQVGAGTRIAACWLCSSHGTRNAVLVDSADAYGGICAACEDVTLGPGVYRCLSAAGDLLYIGSTGRVAHRLQTHESGTPWWPEVAEVKVTRFPLLPEARAAERLAIRAESPAYNILGQPKQGAVIRISEAVAERGDAA